LELDQVIQEEPEALHDFLAGRNICGEAHPSLWPLVEVFAEGQQIEREGGFGPGRGTRWATGFRFPRSVELTSILTSVIVFRIRLPKGKIFSGLEEHRGAGATGAWLRSGLHRSRRQSEGDRSFTNGRGLVLS
jgi:hypothetical protein